MHNLEKSRCYVFGINPLASFDKNESQGLFGIKTNEQYPNKIIDSNRFSFSPNIYLAGKYPMSSTPFPEEDLLLYGLGLRGYKNSLSFPILQYYGAWHGFPLEMQE